MFIDSSGKVGIGSTAPAAQLHVVTSGAGSIRFADGTRAAELGSTGTVCYTGSITTGQDFALYSANAERARIDSSGRLLVGTSSSRDDGVSFQLEGVGYLPSTLQITRNSNNADGGGIYIQKTRATANGGVTIVQSGDELGYIKFRGADGTDAQSIGAQISAAVDGTPGANDMPGRLVFSTTADGAATPTERLRITSDAYVRLASGTGGIQFNGDTAAANALDDYEEGTWTPSLSFSTPGNLNVVYSTRIGTYTKVGRQVTVQFAITTSTFTHTTASGTARVTGLPFSRNTANPNFEGAALSAMQGITVANYTQFSILGNNTNTYLTLNKSGQGQISADVTASDMPTGGTIIIHCQLSYFV